MTVDLTALWDFAHPACSEERMRATLATVSGDDALNGSNPDCPHLWPPWRLCARPADSRRNCALCGTSGREARARHTLEWGRTLSSAVHRPESQTEPVHERRAPRS